VQIPVDLAPCISLSLKGREDAVPNLRPTPSLNLDTSGGGFAARALTFLMFWLISV
jgi:hypothetical protein